MIQKRLSLRGGLFCFEQSVNSQIVDLKMRRNHGDSRPPVRDKTDYTERHGDMEKFQIILFLSTVGKKGLNIGNFITMCLIFD